MTVQPDIEVIKAIRRGDKELYSELVERYQRQVYGIAWSRLGDRDLCEDALQETFIQGYRFLGALRDPEKFGAWISRIARNMAASIQRKRGRELGNLRRWSLDLAPEATESHQPELSDEAPEEDTLAEVMAELPEKHRECLVMFYMEDKSVREAAGLLGVNESAFKTRLHRARKVLRGRMELRIEESLRTMKPGADLKRKIMSAIPALPIGMGGKSLFGGLFASAFVGLLIVVPPLIMNYFYLGWAERKLSENYREGGDFRKALTRHNFRNQTLALISAFAAIWLAVVSFGAEGIYCFFGLWILPLFLYTLLMFRVNKTGYAKANLSLYFIMGLCFLATWLFNLSSAALFLGMLIFNLGFFVTRKSRPFREDYNLFLRAGRNGLNTEGLEAVNEMDLDPKRVRDFARFLGTRFLIDDYMKRRDGYTFFLPPVGRKIFWTSFFPVGRFNGASRVTLSHKGECRVWIAPRDLRLASQVLPEAGFSDDQMEKTVAEAFRGALGLFLKGEEKGAERVLQVESEEMVFLRPPHELKSQKTLYSLAILCSILLFVSSFSMNGFIRPNNSYTSQDARAIVSGWVEIAHSLGDFTPDSRINRPRLLILDALSHGCFPPARYLNPEDLGMLREVFTWKMAKYEYPSIRYGNQQVFNLLRGGYFTTEELREFGFNREKVIEMFKDTQHLKDFWPQSIAPNWERLKDPRKMGGELESYARFAWCMKEMGLLDLIDVDQVAPRLAAYQDEGTGLFIPGNLTKTRHIFNHTWAILFTLKTFDRLDLVDKEACIEGVLGTYRKGRDFKAGLHENKLHLDGSSDIFYALEILNILGALDRVKKIDLLEYDLRWTTRSNGERVEPVILPQNLERWTWQLRLDELRARVE